jgi:hypothetical protein
MSDVFVSYAHADADQVSQLVEKLTQAQLSVWWDKNLPDGRNWDDQVEEALARAATILVVWSSNSVRSENVKDEAGYALDEGKPLSVRLEEVTPPLRWRRIQFRNLFKRPIDASEDWAKVVEAIRAHRPATHTDDQAVSSGARAESKVLVKDGVVIPADMIAPGVLVALSLLVSVGGAIFAPVAHGPSWIPSWTLIISGGLGVLALIMAFFSVLGRRARSAA